MCIGLGVMPALLYGILPYKVDYVPYTASHVVSQLQLLLFSGLAFFLMLGWLKRTLTITLDGDWFYRRLGRNLSNLLDDLTGRAWQRLVSAFGSGARRVNDRLHRHHGPEGALGRTWPTGTMAFWTTVMLAAYLILSHL
jgi:multicomponent Na+:H+ antiporter subunit D